MTTSQLEYFKELLLDRKEQIQRNINDAASEIDGLRQSGATDELDFASHKLSFLFYFYLFLLQIQRYKNVEKYYYFVSIY